MRLHAWVLWAGILLFLVLRPIPAQAHALGRSYCQVETVPGGIDVRVETAAHLLVPTLGLPSPKPSDSELRAAELRLIQQLEDQVHATTPAGPCAVRAGSLEIVESGGEPAAAVELHFYCPSGPVTLENAWRLDLDPLAETVCSIDGKAWVFRAGNEKRPLGTPPSVWSTWLGFVHSGVEHVALGVDHVLFLLLLLVAAASVAVGARLWARLGSTAAVVTGFTLGHSVTLISAGLGWLSLGARLTESVIALSIVAVGVENVVRREVQHRFATAALFGLVHGFGFASVLAEVALPKRALVGALLAFNVGIELAQLGIVLVVFPLLAWAAQRPSYRPWVLRPLSLLGAALGLYWFIERSLG